MEVVESGAAVKEALTHPKYRPDIDGLRAVAVLSVMAFHAFPEWVHGGFIGVDIFFVISGFLISTIIFKSLVCGEFSFLDFYSRRVRRIFPALTTVLVVAFVGGWFILYPDEYRQLGKHIVGGAGFLSNFVLWRESGYFDSAAETKPLLHLWSLGIEEQFYIIFPLFVWLVWKARLNALTLVVLAGALSFLLNVKYVYLDAVRTFYLPQTRVWELMVGSLLALLVMDATGRIGRVEAAMGRFIGGVVYQADAGVSSEQALANAKAWLGGLLIAIGLWKITKEVHFPGKWALLPTLGAAMMIWAGPRAFLNRWLLSHRILVWVGKISYPLYLWHWVLLSYLRILTGETPQVALRAWVLVAAVVLSWLTYRLIEKPLRFGSYSRRKTLALIAAMVALAIAGFADYRADGFATMRFIRMKSESSQLVATLDKAKQLALKDVSLMGSTCFELPPNKDFAFFTKNGCLPTHSDHREVPTVLLIGDSHSASLSLGIRPWTKTQGFKFYQISSGSCSLFSDDVSDPDCQAYSRRTFEAVRSIKPDILVVDAHWQHASEPVFFKNLGNWSSYSDYLKDRFRYVAGLEAKHVVIVGQMPTWKTDLPDILIKRFISRHKEIPERSIVDIEPLSLAMDATMRGLSYPNGFSYVPIRDIFCDEYGCLTRVGPDLLTDLTVWDYGHLTAAGAKFVMDRILGEVILNALRDAEAR